MSPCVPALHTTCSSVLMEKLTLAREAGAPVFVICFPVSTPEHTEEHGEQLSLIVLIWEHLPARLHPCISK